MISILLFDFDMTLVDSSTAITRCLNLVAEHFGLPALTREMVLAGIGLPMEEACRNYWGRYDEAWIDYYRRELREEEYAHLRPYGGAVPLLKKLREHHIAAGIVTNRGFPQRAAEAVGLDGWVDCIVGLQDAERGKPWPDSLLKALDILDALPEEALYVGDTREDMTAASRGGIKGIGVLTGGRSPEVLRDAGACWICDSLNDLEDLLVREQLLEGFTDLS